MATFHFHQEIGRGGFGVVREATREEDGWSCVVKKLRADYDDRYRTRFQREVRIQSQMNHPNVVPIVGINMDDDPPWFIMPKALMNLRDFLRQNDGLGNLWVISEAAAGLSYAHSNGVVHRDFKPENVLVFLDTENLQPYAAVSDFGLARFLDRDTPTITQSHIGMGTLEYSAPEQITDARTADERSDVYSLGKVLYETVTDRAPYPNLDMTLVPREFVFIIEKATRDDPDQRYQSVSDFLSDFELVTTSSRDLAQPADAALEMAQELVASQQFGYGALEPLAKFLCDNTNDYPMLTQVFPRLPDPVLAGLIEHHLGPFKEVLRIFDEQVSGPLAFDYCDVVADFFEAVFGETDDFEVRSLILKRLPGMGHFHNRWHVGTVFGRLVKAAIGDPSLIMVIRDAFQDDQAAALWCEIYLDGISLPSTIRSIFTNLKASPTPLAQTSGDDW